MVPAGQAARADAGQQHQSLDPRRCQLGHRQRDASTVGVTNQHRPLDATCVEFRHHGAGVDREAARVLPAGPIPRPVQGHHAQPSGQPASNLLPVRTRTRLAVQEHDLVPIHADQPRPAPTAAGPAP